MTHRTRFRSVLVQNNILGLFFGGRDQSPDPLEYADMTKDVVSPTRAPTHKPNIIFMLVTLFSLFVGSWNASNRAGLLQKLFCHVQWSTFPKKSRDYMGYGGYSGGLPLNIRKCSDPEKVQNKYFLSKSEDVAVFYEF